MERITVQRLMIIDALKKLGHATIKDIFSYLESDSIKLSLTTIYRNIDVLIKDNIIRKVSINLKDDYYEIIPKFNEHSHFICEKCGKIIDIDLPKEFVQFEDKSDNLYLSQHISYYGICGECRKKEND